MKSLALFLLTLTMVFARAEDWTTTDGQTYQNVKVLSHDDAYVTILDSDGGGKVPLRLLSPDLQKQFGYDAAKAKAAEDAETAQDRQDRAALAAQRAAQQQSQSAPPPSPVSPSAPIAQAPVIQAPALTAPAAPRSSKPSVDIVGNETKISDDQQALADAQVDLRDAQADARKEFTAQDQHLDSFGNVHPNHVGGSPSARVAELQTKIDTLTNEIAELKKENAAAQTTVSN